MALAGVIGLINIGLTSCGAEDEPMETAEDVEDITTQLGLEDDTEDYTNNGTLAMDEYVADVPTEWMGEKPGNPMRIAQYKIGEEAQSRVLVFKFPKGEAGAMGDMSDINANVERWKNDFVEAQNVVTNTFDSGATIFMADGTFKMKENMASSEFTEMPDYMTMAAIIPTANAVYTFKLNGPKEEVEKEKERFTSVIESIRSASAAEDENM